MTTLIAALVVAIFVGFLGYGIGFAQGRQHEERLGRGRAP